MIDINLSDIFDGEEAVAEAVPVFHVHTQSERQKVLEKVVAADASEAIGKAKELLGDVDGLFVSGPHEFVTLPEADGDKSGKDASAKK